MKTKHFIPTLMISMVLMVGSQAEVHAGVIDAGAEYALLVQQVAQYAQDANFDFKKWADIERQFREVKSLYSTSKRVLDNTVSSFKISDKIAKVEDLVEELVSLGRETQEMMAFASDYGSYTDIRNLSSTYNRVVRFYSDYKRAFDTLSDIFVSQQGKGSDVLDSTTKAKEVEDNLDAQKDETVFALREEIARTRYNINRKRDKKIDRKFISAAFI